MGVEIERKFLLANEDWRKIAGAGTSIRQGYLNSHPERTVRVRCIGTAGILTIKGKNNHLTRLELEYPIPLVEAKELLQLCERPLIEKIRYRVPGGGKLVWEIDVFSGVNEGLILAEIELETEEQAFEQPIWLGPEVSGDPRYYNSNLIQAPFQEWA